MKKICTVVGARPQFIKLAVVSRELRKEFREVLIHTGQHYDYNMSDVFFEEMDIPHPDYNLGVSGGTHGQMTGQMLMEIEKVLIRERPDMLMVFGDTNSTMAAALAAVKLFIPVCHVESGGRSGSLHIPEEVNRIVTDHVSSLRLACTASGMEFLKKEGIGANAYLTGDPMYDAFCYYTERLDGSELLGLQDLDGNPVTLPEAFYYTTIHHIQLLEGDEAENINQVLQAMEVLDAPVIYPVHPRNQKQVRGLCQEGRYRNIILTQPVGYKCSISLVNQAKKIITDSGGLQREAFFSKKPCVTVSKYVAWPEIMVKNYNQLSRPEKADILDKLGAEVSFDPDYQPFGDGHSAEKIVERVKEYLG